MGERGVTNAPAVTGSGGAFTETVIALPDEAATLALGARCARALRPGASPLVLHLQGDLGAGKTTFARGVLRALGEQGHVRSPTFALLAEYQPRGLRVLHLDLYRLNTAADLDGLGLVDQLADSALWLIEWPEKGQGSHDLPPADAHLRIEVVGTARNASLRSATAAGREWMHSVLKEAG